MRPTGVDWKQREDGVFLSFFLALFVCPAVCLFVCFMILDSSKFFKAKLEATVLTFVQHITFAFRTTCLLLHPIEGSLSTHLEDILRLSLKTS